MTGPPAPDCDGGRDDPGADVAPDAAVVVARTSGSTPNVYHAPDPAPDGGSDCGRLVEGRVRRTTKADALAEHQAVTRGCEHCYGETESDGGAAECPLCGRSIVGEGTTADHVRAGNCAVGNAARESLGIDDPQRRAP